MSWAFLIAVCPCENFWARKKLRKITLLMMTINGDATLKNPICTQTNLKTTRTNLWNNSIYNMPFQVKNNLNFMNIKAENPMIRTRNEKVIVFLDKPTGLQKIQLNQMCLAWHFEVCRSRFIDFGISSWHFGSRTCQHMRGQIWYCYFIRNLPF